ncbi:bacterial Ig-like domain-containing protein [Micromonospora cremea]|nr:bacterial Ig-like domain-containing protein [Micromonospora cremea]
MALLSTGLAVVNVETALAAGPNAATEALAAIDIPNSDDVRGDVYLPLKVGDADVTWKSSNPRIVSDRANGKIAAGVVSRPAAGSEPANVILTACTVVDSAHGCRDIELTVRPSIGDMAEFTGYGMYTFQNSASEKIYGASSVGNDALTWEAINSGNPVFTSALGSTGLRDPSIVRSPEGDKFYLVATDLWTQDPNFNAKGGWGWAQTGGSQYIEVWESTDLKTWSNQRHVLVNTSPETGMTFAPEAIWDPELGQYIVYWSSAIYPEGTYYTTDLTDPNRRDTDSMKWGRNVTYYTTTRDFVHFSESKRMYDRCGSNGCDWDYGYGNLDPVIVYNPDDGYYYRAVQDRWDKIFERLYPNCLQTTTDLYIERSRSILADAQDWQLIAGCLTINAINGAGLGTASYNEGPNVVKTNPGDVNGQGFYMMADGGWTGTDGVRHRGLQPYFATDITTGNFAASLKWNPPIFTGQTSARAAHGNVFSLTAAEHAAFRGADLESLLVTKAPDKTTYASGEALDTTGLEVAATYSDGKPGIEIAEGFGGYSVSGYDPDKAGTQQVTVSFTVADTTRTAAFQVTVQPGEPKVEVKVLKAMIAAADGLVGNLGGFTDASADALRQALSDAKATYADRKNESQAQLDNASSDLRTALNGLVAKAPVADKSVLQHVYDSVKKLSNSGIKYTAASWSNLQAEISDAKRVLDNSSATQTEISRAVEDLTSAVTGLSPAPPAPVR